MHDRAVPKAREEVADESLRMGISHFAPVERASLADLARAVQAIERDSSAVPILEHLPAPALALNEQRQILFANRAARAMAGRDGADLLGRRFGEAFGCMQVPIAPSGCGTGRVCAECGAVKAILTSLASADTVTLECQFSGAEPHCVVADFKVTAYPLQLGSLKLTIVVLEDVADEKRRAFIERVFFHDILNTAAGLDGLAKLLSLGSSTDAEAWRFRQRLARLTEALIEEIQHQRKLLQAESGRFDPVQEEVHVRLLLEDLRQLHGASAAARHRILKLTNGADVVIHSDRVLLRRILGNLIKNALEATVAGGTVTFGATMIPGGLEFFVHNPGVIPERARRLLFHRSFTTKAESGRGLGTYSVKLLGERGLGGKVTFTTSEAEGTCFLFKLPAVPPR